MTATGPIATFGAITAGSAYTNGSYTNVALIGGNGSGALANITVAGGVVTAVSIYTPSAHQNVLATGKNYQVGDSLSALAADIGGTGSGFAVAVAALAAACENCFFGRIVPPSAGTVFAYQRYCANAALSNLNQIQSPGWAQLIVQDDFWCGEGADLVAGSSFSQTIIQLPSNQNYSPASWNTFTPTITALVGSFTSVAASCRYVAQGKSILFGMSITITTNGVAATAIRANLPVTPIATCLPLLSGTLNTKQLAVTFVNPNLNIYFYDGTYPGADGYILSLGGVYEAA